MVFMIEEKKTEDLLQKEPAEGAQKNGKKKTLKWLRICGIAVAVIVGVIAVLVLAAFVGGKILIETLWGNTNYVSEPEYVTPSGWDVDSDGIGASTDLSDLIDRLEKEQAEKEKAEKEQGGAQSELSE